MSQLDNDPPEQSLRGLFTAEEVVTLQKWLPRFLLIKRTPGIKLIGFWELLEKDYFHDHPLKNLTEEEITRGITPVIRLAQLRKVGKVLCLAPAV